jgi:hypothetical protein
VPRLLCCGDEYPDIQISRYPNIQISRYLEYPENPDIQISKKLNWIYCGI